TKPGATIDEVLSVVPGPDFPTGAYIYGKRGIKAAYETGRGQFTMRAKAAIERPTKEKQQIVVTEIPYQVNKSKTIERIAQLVQEKKLEASRTFVTSRTARACASSSSSSAASSPR